MSLIKELYFTRTLKNQENTIDFGYINDKIVEINYEITDWKNYRINSKYYIINDNQYKTSVCCKYFPNNSRLKMFLKLDKKPTEDLFIKLFVKTIE